MGDPVLATMMKGNLVQLSEWKDGIQYLLSKPVSY